jgi:hypothetical protein
MLYDQGRSSPLAKPFMSIDETLHSWTKFIKLWSKNLQVRISNVHFIEMQK